MWVCIQKFSYTFEVRHEKEVEQIYIECTCTDILQHTSYSVLLCEIVLVVSESHEYYEKQCIHGRCARQIGYLHTADMPFEEVGTADECHDEACEEETACVEKFLEIAPIAAHYVSEKEKVEKLHCLYET